MIQESIELLGLGAFTALSYHVTLRLEEREALFEYLKKALENPDTYVNKVDEILEAWDSHSEFFNALKIKKMRKKEFKRKVVFEVLISGRLTSTTPYYINGYWPVVAGVTPIIN